MKRTPLKRSTGRLKRKSRIRPVSKKRAKRNAEVREFRAGLKEEIQACEICGQVKALDLHEICRGWARQYAMGNRCCILALCRDCHTTVGNEPAIWTVPRQLALLKLRRPMDHESDLSTVNALLTRKVDEEEVELCYRGLLNPAADERRRA